MSSVSGLLFAAVLLWIGAIFQQSLAAPMTVLGARPDFLLVISICIAQTVRPSLGAFIGFTTGLLSGAMAGSDTAYYVMSRTIAGFVASVLRGYNAQTDLLTAVLTVSACTVLAQLTLMFLSPGHDILGFIRATIEMAVYNGVLATPTYALLRRLFRPAVD